MSAKPDVVVDAVGLYCPEPILLLTEEIETLDPGQILELVLDDPSGKIDVERWAKRTGNPLRDYTKDGDEMHFVIEKK